jgi:hypothetical protein
VITKAELLEVVRETYAELDKRGVDLKLAVAELEPTVEGYLGRLERAAKINGLAALVHLEAAALDAERWASDQGSTYSSDPGITAAGQALRFLLLSEGTSGPQGPQGPVQP